jgi:iron complex transport system substrate-binding protein
MNRTNAIKIMQHAILIMLFLSLAVLSSTAEIDIKEKVVEKTADSITVVDEVGRTVTINLPIKNIISTDYRQMEALLALGVEDKIVGVDSNFPRQMPYFGPKDVAEVGLHATEVNYEQILMLEPSLVIIPARQGSTADEISKKLKGVPVVAFGLSSRDHMIPQLEIMGQILGAEEKANKLINWTKKYDMIVAERIKKVDPSDMPTFYYDYMSDTHKKWWALTPDNLAVRATEDCGGKNIASDLDVNETTTSLEVEAEWVLSKDPEFIFLDFMGGLRDDPVQSGPGKTEEDLKKTLSAMIDEREKEGFKNFAAVKNNHVYIVDRDYISGPRWIIGHVLFAKLFHPSLFEDLDPAELNKEYLKEFQGVELEGTWVYPVPT